jgi:hypothetical protein
MKNQFLDIPVHLRPQWDEVSEKVRLASEELQRAQANYSQAVLARIALTDEINGAFAADEHIETFRAAG